MAEVEAESLAQRPVEDLIAISLYKARANRIREYVRGLYKGYEQYLRPLEEVREVLAREMAGEKTLSQEVGASEKGDPLNGHLLPRHFSYS